MRKSSRVARSPKEDCAPRLVVAIAPAAAAQTRADRRDSPSTNPAAKPPLKASPAATVSTASTAKAGTKKQSVAVAHTAP